MEGLTIPNKSHPNVKLPIPWEGVPQVARRACIKKAFGTVKSWHSNFKKWEKRKAKPCTAVGANLLQTASLN
jgi:hypothetical protein